MDLDLESVKLEREPGEEGAESNDYAFLNHSTSTLPNNLPPNIDNKPLARQKRKRTSPEDQAILEAAYSRDPKPDKASRLELARWTALGEKEVQIWFQNRRQTSRRKSRPLLPYEIEQYQRSRLGAHADGKSTSPELCLPPVNHNYIDADRHEIVGSGGSSAAPKKSSMESSKISGRQSAPETISSARLPVPQQASNVVNGPGLGYLANRRSMPTLRQILDGSVHGGDGAVVSTVDSDHGREKPASCVRLSMTSEGNATVTTKDGISPSPPRPAQSIGQRLPEHLTSASPSLTMVQKAEPVGVKRSASGRSRDSRAWEFWCDKDSRSELENKAQKDGNGSAADAIGLIRANSNRRVLASISAKRNAIMPRNRHSLAKRSKLDLEKPSLQRANTSGGRLQNPGSSSTAGHVGAKKPPKLKFFDSTTPIHIPGNDSDKENWSPVQGSAAAPSLSVSVSASAIDGKRVGSILGANRDHGRRPLPGAGAAQDLDAENIAPEADAEVAAFMNAGRRSNSVSGDEELDCVQGLLSLSQGTWAA